ncbi:MAG: CNNM domain-containing protein [Pirellulaceae bacterium]
MTLSILLFSVGLLLSAFFSGSETGFYRVARVRLLLDGLGGDFVSRGLLWLTNNPTLFVATVLVGNNLANYATSLSIVLMIQNLPMDTGQWVELAAPVAFSPVVFVYGELLPKSLFFHAPNKLLRNGGMVFLLFTLLFAPVSLVLWSLGRLLQSVVGEAPLRVRLTLARKELQQVLEEGHEAGILRPAQRDLAQSLFGVAPRPVLDFTTPMARMAIVRLGARKAELLRIARRHRVTIVPLLEASGRQLAGYVRIVDLYLDDSETVDSVRELPVIAANESHIAVLIRMQTNKEELARVVDDANETVGLLYAEELTEPLFRGD